MVPSRDDDEPVSGDLMRAEDNNRVPAKVSAKGPFIRTLFATFSRFPLRNFWQRKKLESLREVVTEDTALFEAIGKHNRAYNRLENIHLILREDNAALEASALAEENKVAEQKRKEGARTKDNEIYETKKEAEREKAIHEAEMQGLQQRKEKAQLARDAAAAEQPDPAAKKPPGWAAGRKQAEITKEVERYEKEKEKIENKGYSPAAKKTLLKAALGNHEQVMEAVEEKYKRGP